MTKRSKTSIRRAKDAYALRVGILTAQYDVDCLTQFGFMPFRPVTGNPLTDVAYERTVKHEIARFAASTAQRLMDRAKEITGEEIPAYVQAAKDQLDATIAKSLGHKKNDDLENLL